MEFIRNLDQLDRVVMPCKMLKAIGADENTVLALAINAETGEVTLKKAESDREATRQMDKLHRIAISGACLKMIGVSGETKIRMVCEGEKITLTAVVPRCRFCGRPIDEDSAFPLCGDCMNQIKAG